MKRVAMLVGALALVGGVLGGCGQEPTTGAAPSEPPAAPPAGGGPSPSTAESPSLAPTGPSARVLTITVRGGQVSGDTGRVEVPLGTPVTINVTSDVADQVHIHGYDKEAEIPAGGTASVQFTADIPGVFEGELHESGLQLLQLQVS